MSTEILINARPNQTRVAYVQNGTLLDLKVERMTSPTMVGSIFRGKVLRVLPGMQAAFVDIGLSRAAFLYVGDIRSEVSESEELILDESADSNSPILEKPAEEIPDADKQAIQDLIQQGQMLLVQVAKDPLGTKGARITTHISLPGRHVVYMPTLKHIGISRKIEDEAERERLKGAVEKMKVEGGVIVRTAGEGASKQEIADDLDYLNRLWDETLSGYDKRKNPGLVHSELDVELRALRDMLNEKVDRVVVDDPKVHKRVTAFVSQFLPQYKKRISLFKGSRPLFDTYDLDMEIQRAIGRKIWLKSGGYIVVDEAEALVVIDVNTGRFVGKKDLEDTILTTNVEAAREIAHQLRIRNAGGIIIIDFIDMEREIHKEQVMAVLEQELAMDNARTVISGMSDLGLVEMTRKRIRPSLISNLCDPCPYCEGKGYIKQKLTVAHEIFRALEREAENTHNRGGKRVRCHSEVADWVYAEEAESLDFVESKLGSSVSFEVEPGFHVEQYEIEDL